MKTEENKAAALQDIYNLVDTIHNDICVCDDDRENFTNWFKKIYEYLKPATAFSNQINFAGAPTGNFIAGAKGDLPIIYPSATGCFNSSSQVLSRKSAVEIANDHERISKEHDLHLGGCSELVTAINSAITRFGIDVPPFPDASASLQGLLAFMPTSLTIFSSVVDSIYPEATISKMISNAISKTNGLSNSQSNDVKNVAAGLRLLYQFLSRIFAAFKDASGESVTISMSILGEGGGMTITMPAKVYYSHLSNIMGFGADVCTCIIATALKDE